ncbi:hypothetical protein ACJMK2_000330 [Sinanodonta woodiana]|uniref:Uncharacterized protein n=1 Tax=Sinanodonta woodiana TaxID=1069815 RepID=A0ABD3XP69_SINWO
MPELLGVSDFIKETWEDFSSPTTSSFDKQMGPCRNSVNCIEEQLDNDRSELTKLKKSVKALYNTTKRHVENEKDIAENLDRIGKGSSNEETEIKEAFQKFAKVTKDLAALLEDMSKSLNNSLLFPLESFLKGDIKGVKGDLRKNFDKAWKDYESKFSKLEKEKKKQASEQGFYRKELTGSEVAEELDKERKIFQLQMCSYLVKVNEIKTKKGADLLHNLLEYYKALKLYFEEGKKTVEYHHTFVEKLGDELKQIKQKHNEERQKLNDLKKNLTSSMTSYKEPSTISTPQNSGGYSLHQLQGNKSHGSMMEGYLLKKSEGKFKKIWQKRKCCINDGIMLISHSDETKPPVKLNLLTCQVKLVPDDPSKRCFDLVSSHGNRTYHFQADDQTEMEKWISVLSNAKEEVLLKAFQDNSTSQTMNQSVRELTQSIIERIKQLPGNGVCCDCGAPGPEWLSTNLGVLICLECCGIHRQLGVHVSRTQSIVIDQLGTTQLLILSMIGNDNFNEVLEARLDHSIKPQPNSPMKEREEFIQAKYVQHRFAIQTCTDTSELLQDLKLAIEGREIQALLQVYAEGLDLMTALPDLANGDTALHLAVRIEEGSTLPLVDFLVQNCNLNCLSRPNKNGDTVLHLCAQFNQTECMKCILRTKPDIISLKNAQGKTAMDVAVETNNQICAELLKASLAGRKDLFEHVNFEWELPDDMNPQDYSDDDLEPENVRKPKSRPTSLIDPSQILARDTIGPLQPSHQLKPRIAGSNNSLSSQQSPTTASDQPPLPPRKKLPVPLPGNGTPGNHVRTNSDPDRGEIWTHRRTPSEPFRQVDVRNLENRNTIHITPGAVPVFPPNPPPGFGDAKPAVPPRPANPIKDLVNNSIRPMSNVVTTPTEAPPPVPAPRQKPKKVNFKRGRAIYDCDADNEDELTFRIGEIVILLKEEEEEWWEGEIEGDPSRRGVFPISFVEPMPD